MAIYQDLVDHHGFKDAYNSVKRFVRRLVASEPQKFAVLEFEPGEETQVDYGLGALTLKPNGKGYARPYLFVMVLRHSRKAFRKCVWKTNQETWARLHEEGWRSFGGTTKYSVLDNLKEGVIKPDVYDPEINPVYAAVHRHYGVVPDPCKVREPDRKGTVESGVKHTQETALKGRKFESIEAQNEFLRDWEERWAATRIHGTTKRQVMEMFAEEKPFLQPLPVESFRFFREETRHVDTQGYIQAAASYYAAGPAKIGDAVLVRIFEKEIEIFSLGGERLRRHDRAKRKGSYVHVESDRVFVPSRETHELLRSSERIGPHTRKWAGQVFENQGRLGIKSIRGVLSLVRTHSRETVEQAAAEALDAGSLAFRALKAFVEAKSAKPEPAAPPLSQEGPGITSILEYAELFKKLTEPEEES